MKTLNYKEYQIIQKINENIEEFTSRVDAPVASEIQAVYNQQQEILNGYDLSDSEMDNITKGLEDTIRTKLGMFESIWKK